MVVKNLLTLADFSPTEIVNFLDIADDLKQKMKQKVVYRPMETYSAAMIFQKRSTRTRVSTETGIAYLGGHALFLGMDDIQLGKNESLKDTARVLSRFNDIIMARVYDHGDLEELASEGSAPVVNLLSDKFHPLQILADLQTIREHFGKLAGLRVAWVGDGNNVLHSIMVAAPKLGMHLQIATPEDYRPDADVIEIARNDATMADVDFMITADPKEAVKNAHVIITDTWISMGQDKEKDARIAAFEGYQVTRSLLEHAAPDWKFMHCLPRKPHEVDDDVFYSDRSIVWDEAENRMYTVMAVTLKLLNLL